MTFGDWQQFSPAEAARELHQRVRDRLAPHQQRAVIASFADEVELARSFSATARARPFGGLSGVPYLLKDIFPVAGQSMYGGSTFLPEVRPLPVLDSVLVQRACTAGAVLAGRTHLQEFAYGITGENPHYGDCEHPRFPGRLTGGSSSGSAAAVAAGIVPLAFGTDTGGSVRVPAAFCGIYGFRLTPRDPLIADAFPLAPSYDTAGWFTANSKDMCTTIATLVGLASSQREPVGCYVELPGLDADVARACGRAAAQIASINKNSSAAVFTALRGSVDTYNTVVADEAWAVHQSWADRFRSRYDPAVWQRLNRVHSITEAQRNAARVSTATIQRMWGDYFSAHDFLVLPATPFPAPTKAECTLENRTRILTLTSLASIGGCPVLTVPITLPSGLSTGLQVVLPRIDSPAISWVLDRLMKR